MGQFKHHLHGYVYGIVVIWDIAQTELLIDYKFYVSKWRLKTKFFLKGNFRAKTAKTPHLIVGDFDSISTVAKSYFSSLGEKVRLVENSDQDTTDLTKTLNLLMRASEIVYKKF